jgi:hypothetical protein
VLRYLPGDHGSLGGTSNFLVTSRCFHGKLANFRPAASFSPSTLQILNSKPLLLVFLARRIAFLGGGG